ncbi:hypothetical protein DUT91_05200 [Phyllobacterium salinisoli]|uniref:Uncharacterized protein n=1 Tax=Phyllobacterium salinisoli TaxID=1899321 RepID=A0A368K8B6_9HYPH|nr:hypothetical protein [Phyllobacterium salinisoli]RCS24855.1 hypothetical protein DUT91_05200 [Phyllobacterium salinisoli]
MSGSSTEQTAIGMMEIAICLAQILHESDASAARRMNYAAGKIYNRLKSQGNDEAAELVYTFGRTLLDRELFPTDDDLPRDAEVHVT